MTKRIHRLEPGPSEQLASKRAVTAPLRNVNGGQPDQENYPREGEVGNCQPIKKWCGP